MNDHQLAIDKICTEMLGWHKAKTPIEGVWWWVDSEDNRIAGVLFDPFTSPNDCNRVMDAVHNRHLLLSIRWPLNFPCESTIQKLPEGKGFAAASFTA